VNLASGMEKVEERSVVPAPASEMVTGHHGDPQ
jgi:hypothetical protein